LSAREQDVAMLIARRLTNQQIAATLVIARSTVDRHVVHILTKLDLSGRIRIAAWAASSSDAGRARASRRPDMPGVWIAQPFEPTIEGFEAAWRRLPRKAAPIPLRAMRGLHQHEAQ
jgi:DNA-binding CsgD family transcriptional regulator